MRRSRGSRRGSKPPPHVPSNCVEATVPARLSLRHAELNARREAFWLRGPRGRLWQLYGLPPVNGGAIGRPATMEGTRQELPDLEALTERLDDLTRQEVAARARLVSAGRSVALERAATRPLTDKVGKLGWA